MTQDVATPAGKQPVLDPFTHSMDSDHFELFESLHLSLHLPKIHLPGLGDWQITKFIVLLTVVAAVVAGLVFYLAGRMRNGASPRGVLQNLLEAAVYFVRDQIARPAIGHDGDKYVPYLATTFLFVLVANLMGMIPFLGSPTASVAVTAVLALVSFIVTHASGLRQFGLVGYAKTFVPHITLEGPTKVMGIFLIPLIMALELMTPFIRVFVLAIRLFANMLAGHTALYVLMYFIRMVSHPDWLAFNGAPPRLYWVVMPFSILMVTAMSLLELLVAGIQAFIFTLLTAIFIGLAKHPAH